jgi:putative pyruvate formate lyase activating enzyme
MLWGRDIEVYYLRPDAVTVWRYDEVARRLSHYKAVLEGKLPAFYRVAKRVPAEYREGAGLGELLDVHRRHAKDFSKMYQEFSLQGLGGKIPEKSYLDLKIEIARKMLESCSFCEWRCSVNRLKGERGVCGLDSRVHVASAFLHMGEEAPLVPSGTIFFTGCSFKCVYCQNWDISTRVDNGVEVSPQELADIAVKLYLRGARNINYVGGNPDQQLHVILESLRYMDVNVPLLWNTNMYISAEALELLLDLIDIWLPDFKYGNDACARRLSGIPNYFSIVSRNHKTVCDAGRDMIIRHLVLPNHVECCTRPVLEWISKNCPRAIVNVMDQYRPEHLVARFPERWEDIARPLNASEIKEAYSYADKLGLVWREVSL